MTECIMSRLVGRPKSKLGVEKNLSYSKVSRVGCQHLSSQIANVAKKMSRTIFNHVKTGLLRPKLTPALTLRGSLQIWESRESFSNKNTLGTLQYTLNKQNTVAQEALLSFWAAGSFHAHLLPPVHASGVPIMPYAIMTSGAWHASPPTSLFRLCL